MTERSRIPILKHHVDLIRNQNFGVFNGRSLLPLEIEFYVAILAAYTISINNTSVKKYPFKDEDAEKKFVQGLETAVNAVLDNNFEEIPDTTGEKFEKKQNYDLICSACPNYVPGRTACEAKKKDIMEVIGSVVESDEYRHLRMLLGKKQINRIKSELRSLQQDLKSNSKSLDI